MKKENFDLQKMGLKELSVGEQKEIDGGLFGIDDVIIGIAVAATISFIDNFGDVREGLSDGWNGKPRH